MLGNVNFPAGLSPQAKHHPGFSRADFNVPGMADPVADSTPVASFKPVHPDAVDLSLPEET